jgi:hypothetical protein
MSLLNCLCAAIPARERGITCEEVFERPESKGAAQASPYLLAFGNVNSSSED